MLTNEELKKKIVDVLIKVDEYVRNEIIKATEEHKAFLTGDNQYYYIVADALIAAGIGDVKDLQAQVNALEVANIALQAGYDDAEKDRLYWVGKYKEAEHRAEVAELVVKNLNDIFTFDYQIVFEQAEKELEEENNAKNQRE